MVVFGPALSGDLGTPCLAQTFHRSSVSAETLTDNCRKAAHPMRVDCSGYFLAVLVQMVLSNQICPRINSGLTAQAAAVALKFLNDHPEKWDQPPAALIGQSFRAAFPCSR